MELEKIPGVAKAMKKNLQTLGYQQVEELKDADPEEMYERLQTIKDEKIDRCVLYVFRTAVAFAKEEQKEHFQKNWWDFKEK